MLSFRFKDGKKKNGSLCGCRSTSACVSPLAEEAGDPFMALIAANQIKASGSVLPALMPAPRPSVPAGPSGDCVPAKRIKTEPPDGDIIQVTVPGESVSV